MTAVLAMTWLATLWSAVLYRGVACYIMAGPDTVWCNLAYHVVAWLAVLWGAIAV